jgi:hypothetical protein
MESIQSTQPRNNASIVSLVAGIISILVYPLDILLAKLLPPEYQYGIGLLLFICTPAISISASITAISTGILSLQRIREDHREGKGISITGIILGVLGLLVIFLFIYQIFLRKI